MFKTLKHTQIDGFAFVPVILCKQLIKNKMFALGL